MDILTDIDTKGRVPGKTKFFYALLPYRGGEGVSEGSEKNHTDFLKEYFFREHLESF